LQQKEKQKKFSKESAPIVEVLIFGRIVHDDGNINTSNRKNEEK
jgi:hypothetical protein